MQDLFQEIVVPFTNTWLFFGVVEAPPLVLIDWNQKKKVILNTNVEPVLCKTNLEYHSEKWGSYKDKILFCEGILILCYS